MALKKTQLLDITSVTGINTVGIFTVGVTPTAGGVGVASTSYIKNVIMHNTGLGTARVSLFINPNTANANALGYGVTANRFLRLDVAPNETAFFESTYPIVMTDRDSLSVEIAAPDAGGTGIGSFTLLADSTEILEKQPTHVVFVSGGTDVLGTKVGFTN